MVLSTVPYDLSIPERNRHQLLECFDISANTSVMWHHHVTAMFSYLLDESHTQKADLLTKNT